MRPAGTKKSLNKFWGKNIAGRDSMEVDGSSTLHPSRTPSAVNANAR
jgi:hypothetical protein